MWEGNTLGNTRREASLSGFWKVISTFKRTREYEEVEISAPSAEHKGLHYTDLHVTSSSSSTKPCRPWVHWPWVPHALQPTRVVCPLIFNYNWVELDPGYNEHSALSLHYYHWEFLEASMCPGHHLIQLLSQNSYILQHLLSCSFFSSPPCHNPNLELSLFSWFFQSTTIQAIVMEVSIEDLGTLARRYSPHKFELLTCLPFWDVCILLGPVSRHPFSFPQIIPCVFGVRRKMEGVGAVLTLFPLRLLLDTQYSVFTICAEWFTLLWLMPANPENSLRATLSCQKITYRDILLNTVLFVRVRVYSSLSILSLRFLMIAELYSDFAYFSKGSED